MCTIPTRAQGRTKSVLSYCRYYNNIFFLVYKITYTYNLYILGYLSQTFINAKNNSMF